MATRRRPTTDPVAPAGPPDVVPARPRTLSDDLRARTDDELAALLAVRPDLLHPVPADIAGLATRATTTVSTTRALDGLDRWRLQVAEVLAAGPDPMPGADVVATIPDVPEDAVREALASLRERALVWGDDEGWHLVRAAREAFGPWPCGLGPSLSTRPEVAPWADDPDAVAAALADAPPAAAELAARMAAGPPAGQLAHAQRPVSVDSARTPVEWLLARGLLVPLDGETVVLPREVALALRGGRWLVAPEPVRPPVAVGADRAPAQVDAAAGQQAHDAVRLVEDLCDAWAVWPPAELRNGGLGVRDLAATSRALDVPERDAATLVEVARAAGLIASDQDESPVWLPTPGYDVWLSRGRGERWATLVRAWWGMLRVPALVGGRDDRGGRINALAPDAERGVAAVVRHEVLTILAEAAAGSVVPPGAVVDVLDARLPRRGGALRELLVDGTLAEAALLGLTGLGALAATGRALLAAAAPPGAETGSARPDPGADPLVAAVEPLLPDPLDHVLLQADLTAVAPGPLDPSLARELALLADVESTGGATVYRFSEGSLRRALDTGRTASDVHALLASRSRTPVPQPLTYLVDDVARRHGAIRVGVASAYVRCDDETTLTALLADRRSAALRAFRLAPTVVAVQATVDETLAALRDMGFAPMAENHDGAVVVRRPDARRTSARLRPPRPVSLSGPTPTLLEAAVRALRAGDRATTAPRPIAEGQASGPLPRTTAAETITRLRAAVDAGRSVRIGYADLHGRAVDRVVDPLTLERGFLTGYDHRAAEVQTYALARITGVAALS